MTTTPCFGRHEFRATGTSKLAWNVQAREDSSKDSLSRLPTLSLAGFAKIWSSGGGGHLFSPHLVQIWQTPPSPPPAVGDAPKITS